MSTFFYKSSFSVTPIERVTLLDGTTQVDQVHSTLDRSLASSKDSFWSVTDGAKLKMSVAYSLTDVLPTSLATIFTLTTERVFNLFIILHKKATPGAAPSVQVSLDGGGIYPIYLSGDGEFAVVPLISVLPTNVKFMGDNATVDVAILVSAL